jgi:predicted MFS family arabinose efflux permease
MRSPDAEAAVPAGSSPARLLGALAWLVGLGLVAGLIATQNLGDITAAITVAGWSIALVGLTHLGTLLADTLGWRALLAKRHRPRLGR